MTSGLTSDAFRKLALGFPGAEESVHMNHPDFRANGRIFATLAYPSTAFGMVSLTPEQQTEFVHDAPEMFAPVPGGWGLKGATRVTLNAAIAETVQLALAAAYANVMAKPANAATRKPAAKKRVPVTRPAKKAIAAKSASKKQSSKSTKASRSRKKSKTSRRR